MQKTHFSTDFFRSFFDLRHNQHNVHRWHFCATNIQQSRKTSKHFLLPFLLWNATNWMQKFIIRNSVNILIIVAYKRMNTNDFQMFPVKKLFHESQPDKSDQFGASGVLVTLKRVPRRYTLILVFVVLFLLFSGVDFSLGR